MEQESGPEVYSPASGQGRCGRVGASPWKRGDSVPTVRGRGGNWDPPSLQVRRELRIVAMELDLVGRVR